MVRSIVLRGFDRQMANLVAEEMQQRGVNFIYEAKTKAIEKQEDGRLLVHWVDKVSINLILISYSFYLHFIYNILHL